MSTDMPGAAKDDGKVAQKTICELIESAADVHDLPVDFFTRLIWNESGFRPKVTSRVGAQGIAQFMPGTAAERGLLDPYDVHQAIPASAHLLRDLRARFGNLGLAAAAYNAGPRRVGDWLEGAGNLPAETRNYVINITGLSAEDWSIADRNELAVPDKYGSLDVKAMALQKRNSKVALSCLDIASTIGRTPAPPPGAVVALSPLKAPWGVQVAANFSQNVALTKFTSLQRRFPAILSDQEPMVVRELNRSRGKRAMFHVRLPADSRDAAERLCRRLLAIGGSCIVTRN
ncbi:hypothetical protein FHS85_003309 [Rhodoligotrophos appendicifer]|uniref:lytic transglycosylase domain-containing protein n=1 Tax=Rhodoligotrophos appendicifer TaxID=987056 RepID=UPI001961564D|nr:lytic transglycosylase domain-containing protein [Rhodoligotrophos appendicifer]